MTRTGTELDRFVGREYESDPVTLERWQAFLWAEATGNPEERFRYPQDGEQFAPPTFGQVLAREAAGTTRLEEALRTSGPADVRVFLGGLRFEFDRPLRVGTTFRASAEIDRLNRKSGTSGSFCVLTVTYDVNDDDGHAFSMETDLIVRDDGSAPGEAGESTDEASESGEPRADDETVVGRRRIESVRPEAMQLVTALVGDPNPLHFDGRYVAEQGLDGRVNQGPVNTSYVAQAASANLASPTDLRSLSVQFDGFVTEGQTVEALARPASETSAGDGRTLALELLADGRTVLTGSATVTD